MSYADRVRQAHNVQEAMLAVAEGIDAILAQLAEQEAATSTDPWTFEWTQQVITTDEVKQRYADMMAQHGIAVDPPRHDYTAAQQRNALTLQELRDRIASETDPEEKLALEARLRILTDTGETPFAVAEGHRAEADEDGIVDLPPADPARRAAREKWALDFKLGEMMDPPMDNAQAAEAYGIGGPLWLYLPQRETIMGLPEHVRRMMVEDVERDSPAQAQELARDILKDFEPNTPDVTVETMANQSDHD